MSDEYIIDGASSPLSPVGAKLFGVDANGIVGWLPASLHIAGALGGEHVLNAGGVGVAPAALLPAGFTPMPGCDTPGSENWGNYQYLDGSVMVCLPKTFYRINHAGNPTYARFSPNDIDVKFVDTFASREAAALGGYALHRAFIDGGAEKPFVLVDKYKCSKQAKGTGIVASSVKNALPLSTASDHNPIAEVTAASANIYAACIDAAKGRDGADGAKNANSRFFCISVFIRSLLALHSLALAQRAISPSQAAWYDNAMVTCFPKGCNNNALRDTNDSQVVYQSDGYSNCGKTGSGTPFERTTHNGQACGVCDLNGMVWEVSIGMTCIATTKAITGATQANPCVLAVPGHGLTTGRIIQAVSVVGMTQLNDKLYTVTVIDPDTISLDGVNAAGFTAYASGGSIAYGSFYAAKESTRMRDFTSGTALATDHWGAVGVAAMMDELGLPLLAASGGSPMAQRFGNAANQVLSSDTSGPGYVLTGIGHPKDVSGMSTPGTDLFGKDQIYQYFRDQLCVLSGGYWTGGSPAGVFARALHYARYNSDGYVGLRCACYPDTANDPTATPPSILGSKVRSASPLWSALAGDEVVGQPLTLATRVRMGVGSGDLPNSVSAFILHNGGATDQLRFYKTTAGRFATNDGTSQIFIATEWPANTPITIVAQVNTAVTKYRVGYMIEGTHTTIQWSTWATFDGSFNPSTLYRLMLGYNNAYPMWFNKITSWKKQATDAEILEAMAA